VGVTAHRFRVGIGADDVVGVLHPASGAPAPCVVACHGMGASKDSDKYLLLAEEFPPVGLALARFDFRGSGESSGAHGDVTIASRIADLEAVLDYLVKLPALNGRIGLLGSSLGGFVALWVAASLGPTLSVPFPVVTWNAPVSLAELETTVDARDPAGPGPALVTEVRRGQHAHAPARVSHLLVIQAERDEVVPRHHGRLLYERSAEPKQLHTIADADHRLSDPRHRSEALLVSRRWFRRHLFEAP
jgi:fermentation-respiration switch protein FrsA (DUF1100 family)